MRWADVMRILYDPRSNSCHCYCADELSGLVAQFPVVHKAVLQFRSQLHSLLKTKDAHTILQLFTALDHEHDIGNLRKNYFPIIPFRLRPSALHNAVHDFIGVYGREHARHEVIALWRKGDLAEEEKEVLVECSMGNYLFDWDTLPSLSSEAQIVARRLLQRGSLSLKNILPSPRLASPPASAASTNPVPTKAQSLAQRTSVLVRLAGSGLQPSELARLQTNWLHPILSVVAFERLFRASDREMIDELFRFWEREWPFPFHLAFHSGGGGAGMFSLGIPLIRLLHMRLLLDTPSLASSLQQPESSLLPEVMLHMLGRECVNYSPELHLYPGSEKGWRRRWAESTGEALSSLFLEDALALDLTTLVRINETTAEETPDFMSRTFSGENIVFESKGATTWKAFCKSKRKAMKQLAKTGSTTLWQQNIGWNANSKGRTFACCLFATTGEEAQPSQFHVEDPPFAFERLFHEGWELSARRRHYAAVLQAAGLIQQATALADGDAFEFPSNFLAQKEIPLPDGTPAKFVGTQRNLSELAATFGFPGLSTEHACRVFTGLEADLLHRLANRQTPPGRPYGLVSNRSDDSSRIPPFGFISSPRSPDFSKGVYSRLSNGSFLAIEIQE